MKGKNCLVEIFTQSCNILLQSTYVYFWAKQRKTLRVRGQICKQMTKKKVPITQNYCAKCFLRLIHKMEVILGVLRVRKFWQFCHPAPVNVKLSSCTIHVCGFWLNKRYSFILYGVMLYGVKLLNEVKFVQSCVTLPTPRVSVLLE